MEQAMDSDGLKVIYESDIERKKYTPVIIIYKADIYLVHCQLKHDNLPFSYSYVEHYATVNVQTKLQLSCQTKLKILVHSKGDVMKCHLLLSHASGTCVHAARELLMLQRVVSI